MDTHRIGGRLASLDALRGGDMLFIIGLDAVLRALVPFLPAATGAWLWGQMGHVAWQGMSLYDLIFPLFVFISGVAMRYSQERARLRGLPRRLMAQRLWVRAVVLVALGILVNVDLNWGLYGQRYASVLGLIGLSCALAGSVALVVPGWRGRALVAAALLALVGALQYWGGDMTPTGCVNARLDAWICPGRLHLGVLDPEGPLCIISATALCMLGFLAGALLPAVGQAMQARQRARHAGFLLAMGAGLAVLSMLCGPVIKNIWTPAFVLLAGGLSCLLLGLAHMVCDTPRGAAWCLPLRIVGANALFIYLFTHLGRYDKMVSLLFSWLPGAESPLGHALCCLLLSWLVCLYLWRRKIWVKI